EQEGKNFNTNDLVFMGNVDYQVNDWLRSNLDIYSLFGFNRQPVSNFWSDAASQLPHSYPVLIPVSLIQDETIGGKAKVFDGHILGGTNQYKNNIYGNFVLGGYNTSISRVSQINTGLEFDLNKITDGLSPKMQFNYDILNGYFIGYNHTY